MKQEFYGEEGVVALIQERKEGMLFYVSHNTPELYDDYIEYCNSNNMDSNLESSANDFLEYRDKQMEEAYCD